MTRSLVLVVFLASGLCSAPDRLTAAVDAVAAHSASAGGQVELVIKVTNTGPRISHLGFVVRSADRWYERHEMVDLGGCAAIDASPFDCGDLASSETNTYSFRGIASSPGSFHYELAMRELVRPFDYVNDHTNGADASIWDETVS